jgi:eukaryotic-like serine/threonine-protein kinase
VGRRLTAENKRVLSGRYHLVEPLGKGAMGSVWKAYDERLERTVAVKELLIDGSSAEDTKVRRERVRREALALAAVEHPVVVAVHDLLYEGREKAPWIVMALVNGKSLQWITEKSEPLGEREVARIGLAVLQGLRACHDRGVYHRDVKPANIVRADDGSVYLVDFGIAWVPGKNPLTAESKVIGTAEYLAPELLNGKRPSPATDLWALAVTLYSILERRSPFSRETMTATFAAILAMDPPTARHGDRLGELLAWMLCKEPERRPLVERVAADLRKIAARDSAGRAAPHLRSPAVSPASTAVTSERPTGTAVKADAFPSRVGQPGARVSDTRTAALNGRGTQRSTPLSGWPVQDAAKMIREWPTDRAAAELLALDQSRAANILNLCENPVAGKLLSAIAGRRPDLAWKFLDMVPLKRAGQLLDEMSSLAAAVALGVPPARAALKVLACADELTMVGTFSQMAAPKAGAIVAAMDDDKRVVRLLVRTANPVVVAGILRHLPQVRREGLLCALPEGFRDLVLQYLKRTP